MMKNYYTDCYNEDGSLKYIPIQGGFTFFKVRFDTSDPDLDLKDQDVKKRVLSLDPQDIPDPWDFAY